MALYRVDPLTDPRWNEFLERHPLASVFHSIPWLEAIQKTYGYSPVVFATSGSGPDLENGLVFCEVNSWLTGKRLVSLPFSDHCDPLVGETADLVDILTFLEEQSAERRWKYLELRPLHSLEGRAARFNQSYTYCVHHLDLTPSLETLFHNCHKDSTQRKIRRAEREGLLEKVGRSADLLEAFYGLHFITRRRHQLPPQPRRWFRNLADVFGDALKIRVAYQGKQAVASILTLSFKNTLVYKYGCSDVRFNNLGGTHFLFWKSIQDAKDQGMREFDLGRSETDNAGLITFKDRWGAAKSTVHYWEYPGGHTKPVGSDWKFQMIKQLCAHAPDSVLSAVGNLLYKHVG